MTGPASAALAAPHVEADFESDDACGGRPAGGLRAASAAQRLSEAIDVVSWMAEQTHRLARSEKEFAMGETLAATFEYMVDYLHHVSIGRCEPWDALARAAAGPTELTPGQLDFLRHAARKRGKLLAPVPRSARELV